jgi:serine/threonine-protein kinase
VPALRGLSLEKATAALAKAGLSARVISVAAPEAAGTVIAQDPASGQQVTRGAAVRVNVSTGPTGSTGSTTPSVSTSVSVATTTVISTETVTTTVTTTATAP